MMRWPFSARPAPLTSPTYPVPRTETSTSGLLGLPMLGIPNEGPPQPLPQRHHRTVAKLVARLRDHGPAPARVVEQVALVRRGLAHHASTVAHQLPRHGHRSLPHPA